MIRSSAPVRIDLAGGTIDIWPLSHTLERPALTVNLAIDLRAEVEVNETGGGFVEVVSADQGDCVRLPVGALRHDRLGLATRIIEWFGEGEGLSVRMRCAAPPQAGLGGSSALAIALAGALAALRGWEFDIPLVRNLETTHLGLPTGYQDYYPARYGGAMALTATPRGVQMDPLAATPEFLARHLMLADTRITHFSGMNNWEVLKRFLDGEREVCRSLNAINACARRMRAAVEGRDLEAVAAALGEEWRERRRLAPVVSNDRIDAIDAAARKAGALAAKVCGAGGGGCMVLVVRDAPDAAVRAAVERAGAAVLDFRPDPRGLTIA
ncbi:MAG: GHMP family kinase ATP-binding protein [Planctomycetota bacterium]|jgi:D-glycero-alpha-D-manno-heptose-7-phosphate kinase